MSQPKRYVVTVGQGEPMAVEFAFDDTSQRWTASAGDGPAVDVKLHEVSKDGRVLISIDGETLQLQMITNELGERLLRPIETLDHEGIPVRVRSDGDVALSRPVKTLRHEAAPTLLAPMTGVILDVKVEQGQAVVEGDPVVVLEAMKMETVLRAPRSGVVSKVFVSPQDKVRTRAPLLEVAVVDTETR